MELDCGEERDVVLGQLCARQLYSLTHSSGWTGRTTQLALEMAAGSGRDIDYSSD